MYAVPRRTAAPVVGAARILACCAVLLLAAASGPADAQDTAPAGGPLRVQRLSGPVQLDGRSDEPAWSLIPPLPVTSVSPVFGAEPSERTEFRIAYDDEYLYVAGRLYDRDPAGIRATSLRRDDGSFTNDWFAVNLDTFRDRETALVIGVSPAGVRTDAVFSSDAASSPNFNWNAFWDGRVVVADDGWHAEIRIPLSSLRFEPVDGKVTMGITVWRRIARRNEMISWPAIEHRWGANSIFKASQMAEITLEGVNRSNPVYVTPYVLAGPGRTYTLAPGASAWQPQDRITREVGADLKYSPLPNVTLDVTVNTDFAQVEADDQQVNLSRFSLFFPEKRLFFQERAALFDFSLGGTDQVFYSRRIGMDGGIPVRLYGGVRAVGRIGPWDLGLLDMQEDAYGDGGSRNAGVLRLRRRVLNDYSYAGAVVTSRLGSNGSRAFTSGVDALLRLHGEEYLTLNLAATHADSDTLRAADRLFARARIERRGIYGFRYAAEVAHSGREFLPQLGFLARRDHTRGGARVAWGWRMPATSPLLRTSVELEGTAFRRGSDGTLETLDLVSGGDVETRSGHVLSLSGSLRTEDLERPATIAGGVRLPAGRYSFGAARLGYSPASTSLLRFTANLEAGAFYDGRRISAAISPTWNPSRHLQLSGTWQLNRLEFDPRDQRLTTHVARIRAQVMVSSTLSGVAFAQYNSAADAVVLNARLRLNPAEGNDLYLVFNQGLNTDRFGYDPVRPLTDNRTVLLKWSYTVR